MHHPVYLEDFASNSSPPAFLWNWQGEFFFHISLRKGQQKIMLASIKS